jgi:hypothetical protein
MSKNTVSSDSSSSDPIEGSSRAENDQSQCSDSTKTSRNRSYSESSRLLANSRSSSFALSENAANENRDSQQSMKTGTTNEGSNEYDNDNEKTRPVSTRHSSSRSNQSNTYTDCGRHSDDWLFKPMAKGVKTTVNKTVKTIFGSKESKEQKEQK